MPWRDTATKFYEPIRATATSAAEKMLIEVENEYTGSRFRLAIVGCGKIAKRHLIGAAKSDMVEVTALVDKEASRAASLADRLGVQGLISTDLDKVLSEVDGAIIATPNNTHKDIATTCMHQGVPVLIEKPLATTTTDAESICEVAKSTGCTVAVGYTSRFAASVTLMKRLLNDEFFGRVNRFAYQFGTRGGWSPYSNYNLDRAIAGGGVLVVTGTHFLDRMLYWFGYPSDAQLRHDGHGGPEANAFGHFIFVNDASEFTGDVRFSKTVRMPAGFAMDTEAGVVSLEESDNASIQLCPYDRKNLRLTLTPNESEQPNHKDRFQLQIEDFVSACRNGASPMVSGEEARDSVRLIESLYEHAETLSENWYERTAILAEAVT